MTFYLRDLGMIRIDSDRLAVIDNVECSEREKGRHCGHKEGLEESLPGIRDVSEGKLYFTNS